MSSRYLPAEAIALLERLLRKNPIWSGLGAAMLYVPVVAWFKRSVGRGGLFEVLLLSLITTAAIVFAAACFYILKTHPGYRLLTK